MVYQALRDLGVPYLWAGNEPPGMDCSGAVLRWMRAGDVPINDTTAGELFARFNAVEVPEPGDLAFYGRIGRPATHVVMILGVDSGRDGDPIITVIGASGGGRPRKSETDTAYKIRMDQRGARVKVARLTYRTDFLGFRRAPLLTL